SHQSLKCCEGSNDRYLFAASLLCNCMKLEADYDGMVRDELLERMMKELRETGDPRVIGDGATFDQKPYVDPEYVPPPKKKKDISF
ncbi:MAG: hypothetical protein VYB72_07630, partial [Planctomycetota bacterium]|nr:hypothetical protein [Planctomycetota bacterium]